MKLREVLDIALEAGEILLRNGAETYRVEESITRICSAYGHSCEAIVLPTGIFNCIFFRVRVRDIGTENKGQNPGPYQN